jgi:Alginate lyase
MQPYFNRITAAGDTYEQGEVIAPPCHLHWKDPDGYWNFWCPVTSDTSGSSSSPRTELRETQRDTAELYNWRPADHKSSRLEGAALIRRVPSSMKVIVAQVHAFGAANPYVKILQMGNELRAEVRARAEDSGSPAVIRVPITTLTPRAYYTIEVTDTGRLIINLNGQRYESTVHPSWLPTPFYFKAGAYVIDNVGPATEGGWVIYESLNVIHV